VRERSFRLPDAERPQPAWGIASILVHALVIALLVGTVGGTVIKTVTFVELGYDKGGRREFQLPPYSVPSGVAEPTAGTAGESSASPSSPVVVYSTHVVPIVGERPKPKSLAEYNPVLGTAPTIGVPRGPGRVWVNALEGRLGIVEGSPDVATHVARVDSAVRAKILAFVDTMPADSFATPPLVTSWVTKTEDGKTWGVDPSWIYLGDFKLPSFILALIPLPQGNYELAQQEAELMRIREEIIWAARQAQTNADFRHYVNETRKRKDAERETRRQAEEAAKKGVKKDTIKPS
jgi:hypothetical protein